ncbi:MAG: hypothetical protein HKN85_09595 [Gammaproteobacteria bacterium]|nr:hypothetical protein [Gammaproteobacteria bacterium]
MITITKAEENNTAGAAAMRQQGAPSAEPENRQYLIAGQSLVFESPVPALAAFAETDIVRGSATIEMPADTPRPMDPESAELHYQGMAQFENRQQQVRCWRRNNILQIDVADRPICQVDLENDRIHQFNNRSFDDRLNLEVITGPALIMLLAKKGVYCLHAGAVSTPFGNIALIAESGVGKSTLSAPVNEQWQQLSDDILPFSRHDNGCHDTSIFIANFPQLKLPGNAVAIAPPPEATVDLILRLSAQSSEATEFRRLGKSEALLELVRHTVAAKLFVPSQMGSLTGFAEILSRATPVVELTYPRDLRRLPQVQKAILNYLQAGLF